jgi:hypothetical protein
VLDVVADRRVITRVPGEGRERGKVLGAAEQTLRIRAVERPLLAEAV